MRRGHVLLRRGRRGASVAEMALVTPVLLLLVAGVIDLGRAFHSYIVITNASREGARYGSHFPWLHLSIKQAAADEAAISGIPLDPSDPEQITITPAPPAVVPAGGMITVRVSFDFQTILGNLIGAGDGVWTLHAETSMVVFGTD